MSLKDRLNVNSKPQKQDKLFIKKDDIVKNKFYENNLIANSVLNLGVLDSILLDQHISSVYINGPKDITVEKNGKTFKSTSNFRDKVQLENIIKKCAFMYGIELDENTPYFCFNHKKGINISMTIPPLTNQPTIHAKCYNDIFATLQTLQEEQTISKEIALLFDALSQIKSNILISGDKGTLKTTILSSLLKNTQNTKIILIDDLNELDIFSTNVITYNFSTIQNEKEKENIVNSMFYMPIEKIFINKCDEKVFAKVLENTISKNISIVSIVDGLNPENAIENVILSLMKYSKNLDYDTISRLIYDYFDVLVFTKKLDDSKRLVSSISQIKRLAKENLIQKVFDLNFENYYKASGVVPDFYKEIEKNSIPLNSNIFQLNYKHTYYQKPIDPIEAQYKKRNVNVDIIKKFKKDYLIDEPKKQSSITIDNDLMQKAQEKFDELKKNVQYTKIDFDNLEKDTKDIDLTSFYENSLKNINAIEEEKTEINKEEPPVDNQNEELQPFEIITEETSEE